MKRYIFLVACFLLYCSFGVSKAYSQTAITGMPCNSNTFSKIPGTGQHYLGRNPAFPGTNGCASNGQYLPALYIFANNQFQLQGNLMNVNDVFADGNQLIHGYDPVAFAVRGVRYMAFECNLYNRHDESVGICIGKLNSTSYTVVPNSVKLFVKGKDIVTGNKMSASVPKVLSFNNRIYLYWTAVEFNPNSIKRLTTRGTELFLNSTGDFVNAQRQNTIYSNQGVTVMDASATGTADSSHLVAGTNGLIYALSHVGNNGCIAPDANQPGCYKIVITKSTNPLGVNAFNVTAGNPDLRPANVPYNTSEYGRWIWENNTLNVGSLFLSGPHGVASLISGHYFYDVSSQFSLVQPSLTAEIGAIGSNIIERMYSSFLYRAPESHTVIQNWSNYLVSSGLYALANGIALSAESYSKNLTSAQFTVALYNGFLARSPESQGVINFYVSYINTYGRAAAIAAFVNSAESQSLNVY